MNRAEKIRFYFDDLASGRRSYPDSSYNRSYYPSEGTKGAINGILAKASGGDANRKLVLKYLTGHTSSTELSAGQWYALKCLVQPYKDISQGWISDNPKFDSVIGAVLAELGEQPGQLKMFGENYGITD